MIKAGDIVKCSKCRACHRLTHPVNKRTGAVVLDILAFNCNGMMRIGVSHGVLSKGLEIVDPVGISAPASKEHFPKEKQEGYRYGQV